MTRDNSGSKNPFFGRKHSEKTRRKMSLAKKGKPLSEKQWEVVWRNADKLRGKPFTGKVANWRGRHHTLEAREKNRLAHLGVKQSEETRKKMSESQKKRRELHWNWKGGIDPITNYARKTPEYREWRTRVLKNGNGSCAQCNKTKEKDGVILHADHIKPFAYFPELRYVVENGRVLCEECHLKTETWGTRATKLYANAQQ